MTTESGILDARDRELVQHLQRDGRAPFDAIARAVGVSEHTVARRYRKLRAAGLLRVVAVPDGVRLGRASWTIRVRCTPDAATPLAAALARRPDTYWVYVLSGGTEVAFNTQPRDPGDLLVARLPRTRGVLDVTAHELLGPGPGREPAELTADDERMLEVLSRDGRATYADLAEATAWSPSTAARRLQHLRAEGVLAFEVEVQPAALGLRSEARLWLSARPAALAATAEALAGHEEVAFAAVTTGPTNLVAQVRCPDSAALYRYLTERVAALDGVNALETAPVLRTVKRFAP